MKIVNKLDELIDGVVPYHRYGVVDTRYKWMKEAIWLCCILGKAEKYYLKDKEFYGALTRYAKELSCALPFFNLITHIKGKSFYEKNLYLFKYLHKQSKKKAWPYTNIKLLYEIKRCAFTNQKTQCLLIERGIKTKKLSRPISITFRDNVIMRVNNPQIDYNKLISEEFNKL